MVRLLCESCSSQEQLSNAKRRRKKEIKVNEIIDNLIDQKGDGAIRKESLPHTKTILGITRRYLAVPLPCTIAVLSSKKCGTTAVLSWYYHGTIIQKNDSVITSAVPWVGVGC